MSLEWAISLAAIIAAPDVPRPLCPELAGATTTVQRMSELPAEIREDLLTLTGNEIREANVPLLNTDAPTAMERNHATVRFVQAARFQRFWLVQFEVALFAGVRTVSYIRAGHGATDRGPYVRFDQHVFAGPACASIRAALEGVTTPGGF